MPFRFEFPSVQFFFYKICEILRALSLVDRCVYMRVCDACDATHSRVSSSMSTHSGAWENSGKLWKPLTTHDCSPNSPRV